MIIALYIVAAVIMAVGSLYFAWHNRDFRKFLAGAFFVSSGILFYLYLADVSVPLLGTSFVETPRDQRWPFNWPYHSLPALFLFRLLQASQRHSKFLARREKGPLWLSSGHSGRTAWKLDGAGRPAFAINCFCPPARRRHPCCRYDVYTRCLNYSGTNDT